MNLNSFNTPAIVNDIGETKTAEYIIDYLKDLGTTKYLVEKDYIDKDYLIDYSRFYSRSHEEYSKKTVRLHFFTDSFPHKNLLKSLDAEGIAKIRDKYLGFVVVKPIKNKEGKKKLTGRTLLRTYSSTIDKDRRYFVTRKYHTSLYGIRLSINSLPFQAQDTGVSACATIALWSAVHPLCDTFDVPRHSPSEITEMSFSSNPSCPPGFNRVFPSDGLTMWQIINYIRSINLDVEPIEIAPNIQEHPEIAKDVVKAYIKTNLPVIATLRLEGKRHTGNHAVVISGYRCDKDDDITKLYVHDDQIGPYSRVKPIDNFGQWENEWLTEVDRVILQEFLVPIYPKIRLPFARIYPYYTDLRKKAEKKGYKLELFLKMLNNYKEELLNANIKEKEKNLKSSFPRFLWIIRLSDNDITLSDFLFDGTSIYPRMLTTIEYIT